MKVDLCILVCFILPYAIGMDQKDQSKDEGLSSSTDEDNPSGFGDRSPESPDSSPPPRGPSRSRSAGQLGRVPYSIVSPRTLNPRRHGAGSCVTGSSMAPVLEGVEALSGFGNAAGGPDFESSSAERSTSAASSEGGSQLHPVIHSGLPLQRSLQDLGTRRRHHSAAVNSACGSGLYSAQYEADGSSKTGKMFKEFKNLNLSTKIVPKVSCRVPVQNDFQRASAENLRSVSRTLSSVIGEINANYVGPRSLSNPSVRDHHTLMRLLERVSSHLQTIRNHPEAELRLQSIDSSLFGFTSTRIPAVIADVRHAVNDYHTPDIDHRERLRNILANVLPDLLSIVEQITGAI